MAMQDTIVDAHALYQTAVALFGQGRYADGARLLGQAAQAGHVSAMSLLGAQLLSGRAIAPDPVTGVRLIMAAAERGGGYACALAGTLFASGVSGAADWPKALDHLQRAAELGFTPAQDQLRLLAGAGGRAKVAPKDGDWGRLRRSVNLVAWRRAPRPRMLSESPLIRAYDGVVSREVCDWIIESGRPRLAPAQVYDLTTGGSTRKDDRRNSAAEFMLADADLVLLAVRERLAVAAGLPAPDMETPQLLHYAVGETFVAHHDFLDASWEAYARDIAIRGQRVATCLLYLNDAFDGGETDFPELGLRHRGRAGDLLVFRNLHPDGRPDPRTLHAGLPPTAGEKWVLSQWIRDRAPAGVGDPRMAAALSGR